MANYCTADDVKVIARSFDPSFIETTVTDPDIDQQITEATLHVKRMLEGRYELDQFEVTRPFMVTKLAALVAFKLLYERYPIQINDGQAKRIVGMIDSYKKNITFGLLLEDDNTLVEAVNGPLLSHSDDIEFTDLAELYADGNRLLRVPADV